VAGLGHKAPALPVPWQGGLVKRVLGNENHSP